MLEVFEGIFSSEMFMPHGHCYLWNPALLWVQVLSNGLIGLSYVAISVMLAVLIRRGEYIPFKGMALAPCSVANSEAYSTASGAPVVTICWAAL